MKRTTLNLAALAIILCGATQLSATTVPAEEPVDELVATGPEVTCTGGTPEHPCICSYGGASCSGATCKANSSGCSSTPF